MQQIYRTIFDQNHILDGRTLALKQIKDKHNRTTQNKTTVNRWASFELKMILVYVPKLKRLTYITQILLNITEKFNFGKLKNKVKLLFSS
jgi:hypothetical protein